ncbi:MAG: hypothetical protein JW795_12915, partial [Chitinivibrionales bacterium]|nr:hypothetical protein [Chitinivibrionales bacterium]
KSVNLSNEYFDLYTNVEIYTQLQTMLRSQLEQARIKSQKQSIDVYLIDKARPAQWKYKPKRALVILAIVFSYMLCIMTVRILVHHYSINGMPPELETAFKKKIRA